MTEIEELVTAMNGLQRAVTELSERADTQQEMLKRIERVSADTRHNRIGLQLAAFGIVLDLALTVFGSWLYFRVEATTHQVQQVQQRTSTEILCPLYEFLALSLKVNPATPGASSEQLELRRTAADTINAGLKTLGCA